MLRQLPILLLALSLPFFAFAEQQVLYFEQPKYDFGVIAEDGGVVEHTFVGRNATSSPIVILDISAGCSCTKAHYSRKPIMPGAECSVTVTFNPLNQPEGIFYKKAVIITSKGNIPLTITGSITPRKKSIAEQYPLQLVDGVRLETNAHAFGYVEHGKRIQSSIGIINTSKVAVEISLKSEKTSGVLEITAPKSLGVGQSATIEFGYDLSGDCGIYGTLQDVLHIDINDKRCDYQLIINGIAIDNCNDLQDKEPQKIQLSENFIKFGTLKSSMTEVAHKIDVCNIGLGTLKIRGIESQKGIVKAAISGCTTLETDCCAMLKIVLNPSAAGFGAVTDRVTIITNDPQQPVKSIKVSAIIEN